MKTLDIAESNKRVANAVVEVHIALGGALDALKGDSNDAEHDALVELVEALGEKVPDAGDYA